MELTTYCTNLVSLIGLGIAIDYSLLIVYRFREEIRNGQDKDAAIVTTMNTAGRAVVFSGTAVAIGLSLLLFMPLPFMRGFGIGGLIIPTVSVVAAMTFLPVLLSLLGAPARRHPAAAAAHDGAQSRSRARLLGDARSLRSCGGRRPVAIGTTALLLLLAAPAFFARARTGIERGIPKGSSRSRGWTCCRRRSGPVPPRRRAS